MESALPHELHWQLTPRNKVGSCYQRWANQEIFLPETTNNLALQSGSRKQHISGIGPGLVKQSKSISSWYLAGTLPNWQGTPLAVAILIEGDDQLCAKHRSEINPISHKALTLVLSGERPPFPLCAFRSPKKRTRAFSTQITKKTPVYQGRFCFTD